MTHAFNQILKDIHKNYVNSLLNYCNKNKLSIEEIASLSQTLANSGEKFNINSKFNLIDVVSTGGPSSLTTILCPLILVSNGYHILKLAIPGRPAGGIDIMAQLKNFKYIYKVDSLYEKLKKSNFLHILSSKDFVPLDYVLYSQRKKMNLINNIDLVISSIIAKKIAIGIKDFCLEIRVASFNNFGKNITEARINAQKLLEVANFLGLSAKCILTSGEQPYQPYIGRGEAVIGLRNIFEGSINDIRNHLALCYSISSATGKIKKLSLSNLKQGFIDHIESQGSSYNEFNKKYNDIISTKRFFVKAPKEGIISYKLDCIRKSIIEIQQKFINKQDLFPDPCGVILLKETNSFVVKNEPVISYRCVDKYKYNFSKKLLNCFSLNKKCKITNFYEEVNG